MMAWIKGLHIACLLVWCAGLICLPLLLARHNSSMSSSEFDRLRMMTRFTYAVVASPAAILAILFGSALIPLRAITGEWLVLKLVAVAAMMLFHVHCGALLSRLGHETGQRPYSISIVRTLVPVVLIALVLWLVLAKPDVLPPLERPDPPWPAATVGALSALPPHQHGARTQVFHLSNLPRRPMTHPATINPSQEGKQPRRDLMNV